MPVSHKERAAKRRVVVEMLKEGKSIAEIEAATGYSHHYIVEMKSRCLPKMARRFLPSTYSIIADLCTTEDSFQSIATRRGVTKQWIGQVYLSSLAAGIPVKVRKRGRKRTEKVN